MATERRHVIFHGRVQGVFFRATTAEIAAGLAVTGFVRNLPDGTVEMEAQGEPGELDRLIESIDRRYAGFIREKLVTTRPALPSETSFVIRR